MGPAGALRHGVKIKHENIVYENYINNQINKELNTIGSIIWDIVRVLKFKTKPKNMPLLITQ